MCRQIADVHVHLLQPLAYRSRGIDQHPDGNVVDARSDHRLNARHIVRAASDRRAKHDVGVTAMVREHEAPRSAHNRAERDTVRAGHRTECVGRLRAQHAARVSGGVSSLGCGPRLRGNRRRFGDPGQHAAPGPVRPDRHRVAAATRCSRGIRTAAAGPTPGRRSTASTAQRRSRATTSRRSAGGECSIPDDESARPCETARRASVVAAPDRTAVQDLRRETPVVAVPDRPASTRASLRRATTNRRGAGQSDTASHSQAAQMPYAESDVSTRLAPTPNVAAARRGALRVQTPIARIPARTVSPPSSRRAVAWARGDRRL